MNREEQKLILDLTESMENFKANVMKHQADTATLVKAINEKVEKKEAPLTFEADILKSVQLSINDAIKTCLTAYNNPLTKLIASVIDENITGLRKIISDSFSEVIKKDEFKQSIVSAFSHKVARSIISNNEGLFDKVSNELKQDAVFKAKLSLAVATVVEEVLLERKKDVGFK